MNMPLYTLISLKSSKYYINMNLLDLLMRYHSTYFKMKKGRVYRATIIVIKNLLSWTPDTAKKTKKKKKKFFL